MYSSESNLMFVCGKFEPAVVPEMVSTANRPATKTALIRLTRYQLWNLLYLAHTFFVISSIDSIFSRSARNSLRSLSDPFSLIHFSMSLSYEWKGISRIRQSLIENEKKYSKTYNCYRCVRFVLFLILLSPQNGSKHFEDFIELSEFGPCQEFNVSHGDIGGFTF